MLTDNLQLVGSLRKHLSGDRNNLAAAMPRIVLFCGENDTWTSSDVKSESQHTSLAVNDKLPADELDISLDEALIDDTFICK